jgi:hypothetical protein
MNAQQKDTYYNCSKHYRTWDVRASPPVLSMWLWTANINRKSRFSFSKMVSAPHFRAGYGGKQVAPKRTIPAIDC